MIVAVGNFCKHDKLIMMFETMIRKVKLKDEPNLYSFAHVDPNRGI